MPLMYVDMIPCSALIAHNVAFVNSDGMSLPLNLEPRIQLFSLPPPRFFFVGR